MIQPILIGDGSVWSKIVGTKRVSFGEESNCQVMQFTGLLDKNGKEIYEGDILKNWQGWIAPMEFFEGEFMAVNEQGRLTRPIEVIGNIYENPELLNK